MPNLPRHPFRTTSKRTKAVLVLATPFVKRKVRKAPEQGRKIALDLSSSNVPSKAIAATLLAERGLARSRQVLELTEKAQGKVYHALTRNERRKKRRRRIVFSALSVLGVAGAVAWFKQRGKPDTYYYSPPVTTPAPSAPTATVDSAVGTTEASVGDTDVAIDGTAEETTV